MLSDEAAVSTFRTMVFSVDPKTNARASALSFDNSGRMRTHTFTASSFSSTGEVDNCVVELNNDEEAVL